MTGVDVECSGLVHVYQVSGIDTAALRGVDLTVRAGERIALFGPSGSGKSTLLAVLAGIRQPSAGQVRVDGSDIARAPEKVLRSYRRDTVGVLLQDASANLFGYASAWDNVRYAQRPHRAGSTQRAKHVLEAVELSRRDRDRPIAELSRAAQQSVALATALANGPQLVLADEPTSELRPAHARQLIGNILELAAESSSTVIVVTHDRGVADAMDRTLLMREGRIGAELTGDRANRPTAVVTADGSVQLPDATFNRWPAGTRVEIDETDDRTLTVRRLDDPGGAS